MKNLKFNWVLAFLLASVSAFAAPRKIVLIAGKLDDHPPGTHEYENNVLLLKHCIETSPDFGDAKVETHFNGWPQNPATLDDADTILLTSGGSDRNETDHPLYVHDHFAQLERQMKRGCGVVFHHWSTFHPARVSDKITEWVGGYFDYENGTNGPTKKWFSQIENHNWTATPASATHPICRGLKPFDLTEEFYFNIRFRENDPRLTPILLKDTNGDQKPNIVAWAVERAEGGRGFGFTAGHFYTNWWKPEFRKLVLNAIAWTARMDVPRDGVESSLAKFENPASNKLVTRPSATLSPEGRGKGEGKAASSTSTAKKLKPPTAVKDSGATAKEDAWKDSRWNQMDIGPFLASIVPIPNGTVTKGLSVRLGEHDEAAVCYDTVLCNVRAGWTAKFLQFDPERFGLIKSPAIAGDLQFVAPPGGAWNGRPHYRGLFLNGKRIVLSYKLGDVSIRETPWFENDATVKSFTRTFELSASKSKQFLTLLEFRGGKILTNEIDGLEVVGFEKDGGLLVGAVIGDLGAKLTAQEDQLNPVPSKPGEHKIPERPSDRKQLNLEFAERDKPQTYKLFLWSGPTTELNRFAALVKKLSQAESISTLASAGPARWGDGVVTKGEMAFPANDPYVVDTITVPYDNPYKALMFLSGVDFFDNGDAAICSIHGDVWIVSSIDDKLRNVRWKRFAAGLFQPLGLKIAKNKMYVLGRDQITRLHDVNGDGEADFYENFSNQIRTSPNGHDYVTSLETDTQGNFYYVDPTGVHRVSQDGKTDELIASGFRNPNGMGVGPDGTITVAPQEGNWTPASAICEIKNGGFYGFGGPQNSSDRPLGYDPPLCWIPRMIDNSTGSQVWATSDKWGPLKGQMLGLSYGRCAMMLVLREVVNGYAQGGVVPLKPRFLSGVMRGAFRKQDGQLYLVGSLGWSTSASRDGCFQRVRYTGKKTYLPTALHAFENGIQLTFSESLDKETAEDTGSYGLEQWNYIYSKDYGSKEWSAHSPKEEGHDALDIKSAKLSADGRSVFLEVPNLQPVMQMEIQYNVNAADGKAMRGEIYNTIHRLGPAQNRSAAVSGKSAEESQNK